METSELLTIFLEAAVPVLAACFTWLSLRLARWIKAKAQNEVLRDSLLKMNSSLLTFVREAEQTLVTEIKKAKADDGKLSKDEATGIKKAVLARFKTLWGIDGQKQFRKALGIDLDQLNQFVEAKIEEHVYLEKEE